MKKTTIVSFVSVVLLFGLAASEDEGDAAESYFPYVLSAQYHRDVGDFETAMSDLERGYEVTGAPELLKEMGELLFVQGEFKRAADLFKRAERTLKDDPDLYRLLVMSFLGMRDKRNSIKWAENVHKRFPDDLNLLYLLANVYDNFEDTRKARHYYGVLIERAPDSVAYLSDYIALLGRLDLNDDAMALYEHMSGLTEDRPDYKAELTAARIYEKRGELEEAIQHYARAHLANPENRVVIVKMAQLYLDLEMPDDAAQLLEPGSMIWPYDPVVRRLLGITYYKQSRFEEAIDEFLASAGLDPSSHQAHYYLGRCFFAIQRPFRAKQHLALALRMSDRYEYRLYDAFVDLSLDRLNEGFSTLRRLVPRHRDDPYLYSILSHAYLQQGDLEKAESYARKAFELDVLNPNRSADLAEVLLQRGKEDEALEYFEFAAVGNPSALDVWFNWAMLLADRGDIEKADEVFAHVSELDSTEAIIFNNWGYFLADADFQLEKAESLIHRALELDPGNPIYLDSMGWVLFRMGDPDRAKYYLDQALETGILDSEIFKHMAEILSTLGKPREALEYLNQAIELAPDDETLEILRSQIEGDE
jgi:tetratricopeptide (TPR) repeat protein